MSLENISLYELSQNLKEKKVSSKEVTEFYLSKIESVDSKLNSMVALNPEALAEAQRIDEQRAKGEDLSSVAGIPYAAKDMFCTKGLATTACSKALENFIPPYSATVINKLKESGMILLGKCNQDEFAMGSSNETSHFGAVKNPWNLEYVPGGSSGGSAAAVAARLTPMALGTDTGGSIRQPASFCGIVGVKPTYGRVSRYGVVAFASSLDQAGPMALRVRDAALSLEHMCGQDPFDNTSADIQVPKWSEVMNSNVKGKRIGIIKEYKNAEVDSAVGKVWDTAIEALKKNGAEIVEVSIPYSEYAIPIYYLVAASEASSNLSRYDGVRFGYRSDFEAQPAKSLEEFYSRNRGEAFGEEVQRRILLGTFALSAGYYDAFYGKACQVRRLLRDQYLEAFKGCDVMLSPISSTPAFKIGERVQDPLKMFLNDYFTTATNLCGLPGIAVPIAKNEGGLPIGVQLTATAFDEQSMFDVALSLEESFEFYKEVPNGL